ncbi:TspO/MBR-related_protein [Hexamita inflata]|uniref:TspO/MBR-related protein n=1 Tax=Hexamita inflata TaxID=28002 RepID=A0AA86TB06_9EUKA|nr:TspO/MBR-related protein [Hexamita inflata]
MFDVAKAANNGNITVLNPPDYVFGIVWGLIYSMQLFHTYYISKTKLSMQIYLVQIIIAMLNMLWILAFCYFKNWFLQMVLMIVWYIMLVYNLKYFKYTTTKQQFMCKFYSCIYLGWITLAQMLSILIWSRRESNISEIELGKILLGITLILNIVISLIFNSGYVCIPQLIVLRTATYQNSLKCMQKYGSILDVILIAYQIYKDLVQKIPKKVIK